MSTSDRFPLHFREVVELCSHGSFFPMIDDFGEKIGGARKDYASEYRNNFHDFSDDDISNMPLSKIWPEPDWEKLAFEGFDAWLLGFIHASRDSIPRKPTGRYAGRALARYVEGVKGLRHLCVKILTGDFTKDMVQKNSWECPDYFSKWLPKSRCTWRADTMSHSRKRT